MTNSRLIHLTLPVVDLIEHGCCIRVPPHILVGDRELQGLHRIHISTPHSGEHQPCGSLGFDTGAGIDLPGREVEVGGEELH